MRALFAGLLWRCAMPPALRVAGRPWPVGLARLVDLTPLARPTVYRWLRLTAAAVLPFYVAGLGAPLAVPYLCLFAMAVGTLGNSQGATNHRRQVLTLVLLVQAVFYVTRGEPAPLDWRARLGSEMAFDALAMHWSRQAVIAVYLTAGLTKVLRSGIRWIRDAPNVALQVIKSAEQEYYSRFDDSHRTRARATAEAILRRPALVRAALTLGLLAELASPLALAGRAAGAVVGIAVVGFHRIVSRYMHIDFPELEWCVVIFVVDVPYWVARGVRWGIEG
jgi:hypothetical protein